MTVYSLIPDLTLMSSPHFYFCVAVAGLAVFVRTYRAADMDSDLAMTSTMTPGISDNVTAEAPPSDDYFTFFLYEVTVPILYGIVTVLGIIGNSLVIYVIFSKERMRTVTNLLLLNLAVADLSFVVVIPPSTAYVFAADRWPFGDVPCRLMHYLVNVTAYVTASRITTVV